VKGITSLVFLAFFSATARATVNIEMVPIGNAGNAPQTRYNGISVGAVDHAYQIGKYEVTAGQYTEFLNAVAQADPHGLYNMAMGDPSCCTSGANIQRSGSSPNFSYSVAADWADRPVNWVSFWDAARFANWLHNGQPVGPQGPGTTEDGAYHNIDNQALFGRNTSANFFIPTEDEWYKAAYHERTAGVAASYFDFPTGTHAVPGVDINEATNPGNNVNYVISNSYVIGPPYYRTVAGEFQLSDSPYGTFDQGGNVSEWNETVVTSSTRRMRGGAFSLDVYYLHAAGLYHSDPTFERFDVGFRMASMPEPEPTGDYNGNGIVDAADYVLWRNGGSLLNDPTPGVQPEDYDYWRARFGTTASLGSVTAYAVPEPMTGMLIASAVASVFILRRRRPRSLSQLNAAAHTTGTHQS
jgi:formylglycine-generating enzyme required for sulfatase activity